VDADQRTRAGSEKLAGAALLTGGGHQLDGPPIVGQADRGEDAGVLLSCGFDSPDWRGGRVTVTIGAVGNPGAQRGAHELREGSHRPARGVQDERGVVVPPPKPQSKRGDHGAFLDSANRRLPMAKVTPFDEGVDVWGSAENGPHAAEP
jgi:hypothetical protein